MPAKIGIVSFAHMHAHDYAAAIGGLEETELVGITDEDATRGEKAAEQYGTRFVQEIGRLLEEADAVVVCSETSKHRRFAVEALGSGAHVLCEKPIATTVEDARAMIEASERAGKMLCTAFPCRYLPAVRRAKAAVDSGVIGRVVAINGTNHGKIPGGWFMDKKLSGGGAVMDHTVHVADLLRWMLRTEVDDVYAEIGAFFGAESVDDAGILTLELASGAFATIDPSWSRGEGFPTWGDVTLHITGTEGVVGVDALAHSISAYDHEDAGTEWAYTGDDMNELMIRDFARGVLGGQPVSIASGTDGLRALEIALAAYRSHRDRIPAKPSRV